MGWSWTQFRKWETGWWWPSCHSHSLYEIVTSTNSSFSDRLLHLKCLKVTAAIKRSNQLLPVNKTPFILLLQLLSYKNMDTSAIGVWLKMHIVPSPSIVRFVISYWIFLCTVILLHIFSLLLLLQSLNLPTVGQTKVYFILLLSSRPVIGFVIILLKS